MTDKYYSNVPISRPVEHTNEVGSFNGFAWVEGIGLVLERGAAGKSIVDELKRLKRSL